MLTSSISLALTALSIITRTLACSSPLHRASCTAQNLTAAQIAALLGPQLSPQATIFARDDDRWHNATERWQAAYQPDFLAVVEPGTEHDVAVIVQFANSHDIPFLAVNRGHGSTRTLARLKNGIEISMAQLDSIKVAADRKSAVFGGGVWDGQVIDELWEQGLVTGTGSCACVGVMGPGLGGGHGRMQGFYGLIIDLLVSLNVVLADGSAVTVNHHSHSDLWWAMRGAGHNFGIVTSFTSAVHEATVKEWYTIQYIFTQDKLEDVFAVLNSQQENGGQPKELMNYMVFTWDPSFSTTEPAMQLFMHYVGSAEDAALYLEPFEKLNPSYNNKQFLPYPDTLDATGTGLNSPMCQDGHTNMQFPFGMKRHNITAVRQIWDYYANVTTAQPLYNQSIVVFEAYSLEGVQRVDSKSTAFPHREDNLLCDVLVTYDPDSRLDSDAIAMGRQIQKYWEDGQKTEERHIYVNYAFGDEPLEQMYGKEPWRLERLRAAKAKYDPHNRFGFYNPIYKG